MALSGTSGGCYKATNNLTSGWVESTPCTWHFWLQASATPSTANLKRAFHHVSVAGNNPDGSFDWNNTNASFYKSYTHKNGSTYYPAQMGSTPAANTWHSIACLFDGTKNYVYLNGSLDGTSASNGNSSAVAGPLALLAAISGGGTINTTYQFSTGQIAEFAFWSAALTVDEIGSLAKGFRASRVRPQSIKQYSPLIRLKQELYMGNEFTLASGSEVITDHPRVIG